MKKVLILVDDVNHFAVDTYITKDFKLDYKILELYQNPNKKKTPTSDIRTYLNEVLLPEISDKIFDYILCCNADYFKILTKKRKAEAYLGYALPLEFVSLVPPLNVFYGPSVGSFFYDATKAQERLNKAVTALYKHATSIYTEPGSNVQNRVEIIQEYQLPELIDNIIGDKKDFTFDLETYSLKHYNSGLGSIAIALDINKAYSLYVGNENHIYDTKLAKELKRLFTNKKSRCIAHNFSFDAYILVYQLFMKDVLDQRGLLYGLKTLTKNWDCTQIITYLATNTCSGNDLSLKTQAQEFAGNYALDDIKDIRKIDKKDLLIYNGVDALSTWFTYDEKYPILLKDNQKDIYENIFKPSMKEVLQMQLTGIPVDYSKVSGVEQKITNDLNSANKLILNNPYINKANRLLAKEWVSKRNKELKVKKVGISDYKEQFNISSPKQLRVLLYDSMGLIESKTTASGEFSTDKNTLEHLINKEQDIEKKELLKQISQVKLATKILTTYIPIFRDAYEAPNGWHYVYGSFKLGGTVSGRMCVSEDTLVTTNHGLVPIINVAKNPEKYKALTHTGKMQQVLSGFLKGREDMYEVSLESGKIIKCTLNHVFYTDKGWLSLKEIMESEEEIYIYETN